MEALNISLSTIPTGFGSRHAGQATFLTADIPPEGNALGGAQDGVASLRDADEMMIQNAQARTA